jgi:ribosomal protein L37E
MGKKPRFFCTRCEQRVDERKSFCRSCGFPTAWASHDEKVEWELQQWEDARIKAVPDPVLDAQRPRAGARTRLPRRSHASDVVPVHRSAARKPVTAKPVPSLPTAQDNAVLIKVLRLLNAKVAELETRIAELEGTEESERTAR